MNRQPRLAGVGIGLRRAHHDTIVRSQRRLDQIRLLAERVDARAISDHLCWSVTPSLHSLDLLPLPFHDEAVEHVASRARQINAHLGGTFALENISYYAQMPASVMSEGQFVSSVLRQSGCGLLLDVNNVYVNARNHGIDPIAVLEALPIERVSTIHVAGHREQDGVLIDDHASAVCDEVWLLLREALRRTGPVPILVEWDQRVPALERVLDVEGDFDFARAHGLVAVARDAHEFAGERQIDQADQIGKKDEAPFQDADHGEIAVRVIVRDLVRQFGDARLQLHFRDKDLRRFVDRWSVRHKRY